MFRYVVLPTLRVALRQFSILVAQAMCQLATGKLGIVRETLNAETKSAKMAGRTEAGQAD